MQLTLENGLLPIYVQRAVPKEERAASFRMRTTNRKSNGQALDLRSPLGQYSYGSPTGPVPSAGPSQSMYNPYSGHNVMMAGGMQGGVMMQQHGHYNQPQHFVYQYPPQMYYQMNQRLTQQHIQQMQQLQQMQQQQKSLSLSSTSSTPAPRPAETRCSTTSRRPSA